MPYTAANEVPVGVEDEHQHEDFPNLGSKMHWLQMPVCATMVDELICHVASDSKTAWNPTRMLVSMEAINFAIAMTSVE